MTRTVAMLDVSERAFQEIADKLRAAEYQHLFMSDGSIDMYGIAIARAPDSLPRDPFLPDGIRAFLTDCASFHGQMVKGNWLSSEAAKLLADVEHIGLGTTLRRPDHSPGNTASPVAASRDQGAT
jgi:hypothetical protein